MVVSQRHLLTVGVILVTALFARPTLADDVAAAKRHYERGTALYDLQRYVEAAKEYEAAFEAKNDPALLFNIAQAYRFGGDYNRAIVAFRSYLRRVPNAGNRAEVEARIAELQTLTDQQKKNQLTPPTGTLAPGQSPPAAEPTEAIPPPRPAPVVAAPPPTKPTSERRPAGKLIAGIVMAAAGVAAVAAGAAFEGLAAADNDTLSHPTRGTTFDPRLESSLKTEETVAPILLAVGGASLVTGVVLTVMGLRERAASRRVAIAPAVSSTHIGLFVDATF